MRKPSWFSFGSIYHVDDAHVAQMCTNDTTSGILIGFCKPMLRKPGIWCNHLSFLPHGDAVVHITLHYPPPIVISRRQVMPSRDQSAFKCKSFYSNIRTACHSYHLFILSPQIQIQNRGKVQYKIKRGH